ncbi:hypothetical protein ACFL35_20770 [Candidatus Riflebacteria bacterium]
MTQIPKRERLSIDVHPDEHRKIKAFAALDGKSIREFVLECVREALQQKEERVFLEALTISPSPALEELWDNDRDAGYDDL